jgi:hypothetical protein
MALSTPGLPTHVRCGVEAVRRYGDLGRAWVEGTRQGDPLADAVASDMRELGRARVMRAVETALRGEVPADAPDSVRALFAVLDDEPDWVDHDQLDRAGDHLARHSLQLGLVLAAASLMVGYTNPAAARPLVLTGRLVGNAGVRNLEVGDWLREVTTRGGLRRHGLGLERTVRVRLIHAMVRRHLSSSPDWDEAELGTPISQPYLAHTLAEFGSIAVRGMHLLGARYTDAELADLGALWRYVGHLSGVVPQLLPTTLDEQLDIEALYQLTRPPVDEGSRALVAGLIDDYLVPEVEDLLPGRLPARARVARSYVDALVRALVGDALSDELGIRPSRLSRAVPALGHLTAVAYAGQDRLRGPAAVDARVTRGRAYQAEQEQRLREKYAMTHDLVDVAPDAVGHPVSA